MNENSKSPTPEHQDLRYLILNSKEPLIFKRVNKWHVLSFSLEDWSSLLGDRKLSFRCGRHEWSKEPQWERYCTTKFQTFEDFLNREADTNDWVYFDYKYLKEHLEDVSSLREDIKWDFLGFPEVTVDDSTLWIGSKGAHTPCHFDSYGCNLIAQVFGRKEWLIFPPEEDLKPSRIPYEESSVYSKLNFFSPTNIAQFCGIDNCRKVILEPGDVLFLPHKWWHYVENLENAISINTWLPLEIDKEERLCEALVRLNVFHMLGNCDQSQRNTILNPNSDKEFDESDFRESFHFVSSCVEKCKEYRKKCKGSDSPRLTDSYDIEEIFQTHEWIQKVPALSRIEFLEWLNEQKSRFRPLNQTNLDIKVENSGDLNIVSLIEAISHPNVISLIRDILIKQ